MTFLDKVKYLQTEFPVEYDICKKAISQKKREITMQIRLFEEELFVTPTCGLFGEDLRTPIINKINELVDLRSKL